MPKLTQEQKEFIVQRLAVYDSPAMVTAAVKERFGIDVPRTQVEGYDPASYRARSGMLSDRLINLFNATREKFKDTIDDIPIASRSFRLRRLNAMHDKAFDKGNHLMAAQHLEQAAKEVGETFSNKRKVEHSGSIHHTDELTPDDKRTALVDRLAEALQAAATRH